MIIKLQGGLGNQMFQFAAAKCLAIKNSCDLQVDLSFLRRHNVSLPHFTARNYELGIFRNINCTFTDDDQRTLFFDLKIKDRVRKLAGLNYPKVFKEKSLLFDPLFFSLKPPVYLDGYFQSEKYFEEKGFEIRHGFEFPSFRDDDNNLIHLNKISQTCAVSVHVRRGDFQNPGITEVHGILDTDYYMKAIKLMKEEFPESVFYFFSDDMEWVKANLLKDLSGVCVEGNIGENSWKDMLLMSRCRHHIVANSSFSWWGAWLGIGNGKKVIAPKRWIVNDVSGKISDSIIPSEWQRI